MQCLIDVAQALLATLDRQVGKIDVHRQPWQVTDKQIDRSSPFQRKAGLPGHKRQQLDKEHNLSIERSPPQDGSGATSDVR